MNIRKILLLCFSILIAMVVIGCTSDAIPSDVPNNDRELKTTPLSIYFQREDGIYRYNELGDTLEWFTYLPQGNVMNCFFDEARNTIYYSIEKDPIYLFCKTDISTGQETVIASDVGFGRGNIYNGCIYFYDFVSGYVTEYNIQTGNLKRFQSSHRIDGNGTVKIYDGDIYFFSTKLHHIFSDDSGTKVIADRKNYSYRGYFYDNNIFYMNKDNIAELHLLSNDGYKVVTWKDGRLVLIHQGTAYEKPLFNGVILYTRYGGAPTHIDYQYITLDFESMNSTAVSFQKYQSSNGDYDNESAYDTF